MESLKWIQLGFLTAITLTAVGLYSFYQPVRLEINLVIDILQSMDAKRLGEYFKQFGMWAIAVSFGLMLLQAIIAPIPAFVITIANGLTFGWFWGGLLCLVSATIVAQICFEISRILGRPIMAKLIGASILETIDNFMHRYGVSAILVARLLPVVPFDPISYAAGLTMMTRMRFLISNLIGQLPATIIFAYFGEKLRDGLPWPILATLLVLTGIVILASRRLVPATEK